MAPQVYDANGKKLPLILWTNSLTEEGHVEKYLSKDDYIIQIWTKGNDSVVKELIEKDFKVIFSNYDAWYLDCGYSSWVGEGNNWCSPYKGWQVSPKSSCVTSFYSAPSPDCVRQQPTRALQERGWSNVQRAADPWRRGCHVD